MKVLVNGGINISELDGWWAEAYSADVGWALGDGKEHGDDPAFRKGNPVNGAALWTQAWHRLWIFLRRKQNWF